MAAAFNVELSEATITVYMESLSTFSELQLSRVIRQVIIDWQEPSKMPPLNFILTRMERSAIVEDDRAPRKDELDPEKCPKDWSVDDVYRGKLTLYKARKMSCKPMPREAGEEPEPIGEGRKDYAKRIIQELHERMSPAKDARF